MQSLPCTILQFGKGNDSAQGHKVHIYFQTVEPDSQNEHTVLDHVIAWFARAAGHASCTTIILLGHMGILSLFTAKEHDQKQKSSKQKTRRITHTPSRA
jgi:hypothetical protein